MENLKWISYDGFKDQMIMHEHYLDKIVDYKVPYVTRNVARINITGIDFDLLIENLKSVCKIYNQREIKQHLDGNLDSGVDNRLNKLLIILCKYHGNSFKELVFDYIPTDIKTYRDLQFRFRNSLSFLYFRFFFFFYILITYVYNTTDNAYLGKDDIKLIYLRFLEYCLNFANVGSNNIVAPICNNFIENYEYLYSVLFIDKNFYLHVYFNNIIKYFLPLPYEVLKYSPIITYRKNVTTFYKKNNIDYLGRITEYETIKTIRYVKSKNIDMIKNEIDIHIPISLLNFDNYKNDLWLIAININNGLSNDIFDLVIAKNIAKLGNKKISAELSFIRKFDGHYNKAHYEAGLSFETLSNMWEVSTNSIEVDIDDIVYISIFKKMQKRDIFNVFNKITFKKSEYPYLFHYTGLELQKQQYIDMLKYPTFFAITPFFNIDIFFANRKCILYEITSDVNVLDITDSIISKNPITRTKQMMDNDRKNKLWKYFDMSRVMDYYENKELPVIFNENNKCIFLEKITNESNKNNYDLMRFIKNRPYCDVNDRKYYAGRRRLQELFYKTRKYDASKIWIYDHHFYIYKKYGIDYDSSIYNSIYHHPEKIKANIVVPNNDVLLLMDFDIRGFFSTDYEVGIKTGGELLLTVPNKNINFIKFSDSQCGNKKLKFFDLSRSKNKIKKTDYAYVTVI